MKSTIFLKSLHFSHVLTILFIYFFLGNDINLFSQNQWVCDGTANSSQRTSEPQSTDCDNVSGYAPDPDYFDHTPIITVYLNFHYILDGNGEGNFTATDDGGLGYSSETGVTIAEGLVERANNRMQYLEPYTYMGVVDPNVPHISDSRIRFEIYTDPNNSSDIYGGIWFWSDQDEFDDYTPCRGLKTEFSQYGSKVLNVIMGNYYNRSSGVPILSGCSNSTKINVTDYYWYYNNTLGSPPNYNTVFSHELFHTIGPLCHSFSCENDCEDLSNELECNSSNPSYTCRPSCGANPMDDCQVWGVSNNIMGYNTSSYNLTPCQLGITHERLTNSTPPYVARDYCEISSADITINDGDDILWAINKKLRSNVIIESGGKLTITCTVGMPEGAKFIVEQGGRLIIDGGAITKNCDNYWGGIEVWGNPALYQVPFSNQGNLRLKNGAVVEYANVGIRVGKTGDNNSGGGYVQALESYFYNNLIAVEYIQYDKFFNLGQFYGCDFIINAEYPLTSFSNHVRLTKVNKVVFSQCDFDNSAAPLTYKGIGINSMDAGFTSRLNLFKGLWTGIAAYTGGLSIRNYLVHNTTFEDNFLGIYNRGVNNPVINNGNKFSVGGYSNLQQNVGVYIHEGTGYKVADNVFLGITGADMPPLGTVVRETGSESNLIGNNNEYENFQYGNLSNGLNRNPFNPFKGLQYLCNQNTDNDADFGVPDQSGTVEGIAANQGTRLTAAGNKFSHRVSPVSIDFENSSVWPVFYWYNSLAADETPINYSGIALGVSTGQGCSTGGVSIEIKKLTEGEKTDLTSHYNNSKQSYDQGIASYNALMDGGNSGALLTTIASAIPSDSTALFDTLMAYAPYLSEDVILSAADKTTVLSHEKMKDVLIGTPDESRKPWVIKYMEQKTDPMPEGMITQVLSNIDTASIRTEQESELSLYAMRIDSVCNRMIIDYLVDSTSTHFDTIRLWLRKKGSFESELMIVDSYLEELDTTSIKQYMDSIPTHIELSSALTTELNAFESLKSLQINWIKLGKTILDLDTADISSLLVIANTNSGRGSQQAKNILEYAYGYDFYVEPVLPDTQSSQQYSRPFYMPGNLIYNEAESIEALPNPAKDNVRFNYQLSDDREYGEILIFDINGKVIKRFDVNGNGSVQWDARLIPSGIYLYGLKTRKGYNALKRLVIGK